MIPGLLQIVWLALFSSVAIAIGARLMGWWNLHVDVRERVPLAWGLGVQVVSFGILGLGLAGWLYREVVLGVLAVAWLACWGPFRATMGDLARLARRARQVSWSSEDLGYALAIGLALALTWLGTLLPETYGDSLFYHLGDPKYFVTHHRIEPVPYTSNSLFPYGVEMLFTLALLLQGVTLAKGMNLMCWVMIAWGLYALTRPRWSRRAALRVAALGVITPVMGTQAATTYVEVALALYVLLAVWAATRWMERGSTWGILAGLFIGMVLSIKHLLSIMFVGAFMLALVGELAGRRVPWRIAGRGIAAILLVALGVSGIWYARAWHYWGNPFYPFSLPGMEGSTGANVLTLDLHPGFGKDLQAFLQLPWHATMTPQAFVGSDAQWGPLFLALAPGMGLAAFRFPYRTLFSLLIGASVGLWFLSIQSLRYLLPLLPLVAWWCAPFLDGLKHWHRWSQRALTTIIALGVAINLGSIGYFHRAAVGVLLGHRTAHEHLIRMERSSSAAQWVNAHLPMEARILLVNELRRFYFDRELILEQFYFRQTRYDRAARHPDQVVAKLKQEGVTHLVVRWIDEPATEQGLSTPLAIQTLLKDPQFVARHLDLLGELPYQTPPNQRGRYLVYAWR